MEESLEDKIEMMDRLSIALHRAKLRRFYSISGLKTKIPALRIWSDEQLKQDLEIFAGSIIVNKIKKDQLILKKEREGIVLYRYNPANYQRHKLLKQMSYSLKTDDELREIRKKELEFTKLEKEVKFWKDSRYWAGVLTGFIPTIWSIIQYFISRPNHH